MERSRYRWSWIFPGRSRRLLLRLKNRVSNWRSGRSRREPARLSRQSMKGGYRKMPHSTDTARPLQGKRILVTRTREQAGSFSERLSALGAISVEFPVIRIVPPLDWQPLDEALRHLCDARPAYYAWLIFTSVNGVE